MELLQENVRTAIDEIAARLVAMTMVACICSVSYISRVVISKYLDTVVILPLRMIIMTLLFLTYNLTTKWFTLYRPMF